MYLIAKQQGRYQAIPIRIGNNWDLSKLHVGRREVRIILRVRGRHYLLYHTRVITAKYPKLTRAQLTPLCDEIIDKTSECIGRSDAYIDFEKIAAAAECRHQRLWRDQGLISPATPDLYHGHHIDPQAEILSTHVRIDLDDIIKMDREPPVDCAQEELPY